MPVPVVLFVYNRPEHTKATLEALARNTLAQQTDLFIFSDGAKHPEGQKKVDEVRSLLDDLQGFASVSVIKRPQNMGLANSVIAGVAAVFEQSDTVIVLEDDLITAQHFLSYMNDALAHYRNDPKAFSVTGHNFPEQFMPIPKNYEFDTYASCRCSSWSWGTWRDRWQKVDWSMAYYPTFCCDQKAQEDFNRGGPDMTPMLRMQHEGKIDAWDIRFCYAHNAHAMNCIYPVKTLVRNIGLDGSGVHSTPEPKFTHLSLDETWQPKKFVPAITIDPRIMKMFRAIFEPPVPPASKKVKRPFKKMLRALRNIFYKKRIDTDILVVNTYQKQGGAARAAWRMFCGIREYYPNARYLTLFKEDTDPSVVGIAEKSTRAGLARRLIKKDFKALKDYPNRKKAIFSPVAYANFFRMPLNRFRPKLVHLHWVVQGVLRIEELARLKCPIVWTLHDTWAFTGGCHYTGECTEYQAQCGKCPQLGSEDAYDLSYLVMQRKAKAWEDLNLTIVTPSRWLADMAAKSSLFKGRRIEVIPNGLDTQTFKPIESQAARTYFGIDPKNPVFLFTAQWLTDPRKGGALLLKALASFQRPCTLLTCGEGKFASDDLPFVQVRSLGSLQDNASLALAYSAADVFICPSREDNLPNTVAEALSCGTPCAAFNINGLPDMIEHQKTGWLAKPFDPVDLANGMRWLTECPDQQIIRNAARAKAVAHYSMENMTRRYEQLYQELTVTKR